MDDRYDDHLKDRVCVTTLPVCVSGVCVCVCVCESVWVQAREGGGGGVTLCGQV